MWFEECLTVLLCFICSLCVWVSSFLSAPECADPWILELAKKQRMNTDVRKNIFCILMTSEVSFGGVWVWHLGVWVWH